MKFAGFQPAKVAQIQEANGLNQRAKDFYSLHAQDIRARWAKGLFEGSPAQVERARAMMDQWNRQNPDQRIVPNMPAIIKKVREMRKSKDQRIADTAPRAMRANMKRELSELRSEMQ